MKNKIFGKEERKIIVGDLKALKPMKSEKATGFVAVIGEGDDAVSVAFFDNDKVSYTDRLEKSGIKKTLNKPIMIEYTEVGKINRGFRWEYAGSMLNLDENTAVFFARVGSIKDGAKGQAQISVPVRKNKDETDWYNLSAWNREPNEEKGIKANNLADNAKKYLKKGDLVVFKANNLKTLDSGMLVGSVLSFDKVF